MGGTQKAPPRLPRRAPPQTYRVYAHISGGFEAACPACGTLAVVRPHRTTRAGDGQSKQYDTLSGVWRCRACRRKWYVGLIFWAVSQQGHARPADHVMTAAELAQLRELTRVGYVAEARSRVKRPQVNRVCWCEGTCPVHGEATEEGGGDEKP